ncbi:aminotransferase class V-fold PLP-dependent enzyme [Brachybacterium sp. AOP43-C2-M15]|uniref:aminotransferase class V-fold PLP-dependent enzyme n=1 Tax=Brachybacterium sp. AOP43-C2-M15 TaxID=3457661 RepID=UPI0040336A4B
MPGTALRARDGRAARELWDLDPEFLHLNHGSFGAVPRAVLAVQAQYRRDMETNPVRWFSTLAEHLPGVRSDLADRLAVRPSDLVMVANASAGASVLYRHLAQRPGPVHVAVTDHGYGAVSMGAERLARETAGSCREIPVPLVARDDEVLDLLARHLATHRTDLLVIDQVTSATARRFPVVEASRLAHEHGAVVLVDGAHAPGALADPVVREADVWIGNLHKFWCAPRGSAVLVRNNPDLDLHPLVDSWGGQLAFPDRFDHQGTADVTAWFAAAAAFDHLEQELGWDRIREHAGEVMQLAEEEIGAALSAAGVEDPVADVGHPFAPMRLFRLPGDRVWDHDAVDALRVPFMNATACIAAFTELHGDGFLRVSAAPYTTAEDIAEMASHGIPTLADMTGRPLERTAS